MNENITKYRMPLCIVLDKLLSSTEMAKGKKMSSTYAIDDSSSLHNVRCDSMLI